MLSNEIIIILIALFTTINCLGQTISPKQPMVATQMDSSSSKVIYFEDFNNNKNNWTVADNKNESARIDSGFYYLTAVSHAYGEAQEVKIDTRKDFEIETRIKILSGNLDHKNYYSMLFWGREAMNSYYFTFSKDGFASIELCDSKNQSSCITQAARYKKPYLTLTILMCIQLEKRRHLFIFD